MNKISIFVQVFSSGNALEIKVANWDWKDGVETRNLEQWKES